MKTKRQQRIDAVVASLPRIKAEAIEWGFNACLSNGFYSADRRGNVWCYECGSKWKHGSIPKEEAKLKCPSCNKTLTNQRTHNRRYEQSAYMNVIDAHKGYQIVRQVLLTKNYERGKKPYCSHSEVLQHWIDERGNVDVRSKAVIPMAWYCDMWQHGSALDFRTSNSPNAKMRYSLSGYGTYPKKRIIPMVRRAGYKGNRIEVSHQSLIPMVLKNNYAETLIKCKQYDLLKLCDSRPQVVVQHWGSIKICIRNKYIVKDAKMWVDMLDSLQYFGKDLRNAKYVCPENLVQVHDYWMDKKMLKEAQVEAEQAAKKMIAETKAYKRRMAKWLSIEIKSGNLTIKPLQDVQEFFYEGKAMHHCVYTNEYYKKSGTLVLSAKIDGRRMETIEVDLKQKKVVQSYGHNNQVTEYNDKIKKLVNNNLTNFNTATK